MVSGQIPNFIASLNCFEDPSDGWLRSTLTTYSHLMVAFTTYMLAHSFVHICGAPLHHARAGSLQELALVLAS